jgi:hypothetical protein
MEGVSLLVILAWVTLSAQIFLKLWSFFEVWTFYVTPNSILTVELQIIAISLYMTYQFKRNPNTIPV